MTTFSFAKATKKAAKGRIALDGPSGSGKTYTALTIATTLGQRIAVIDTEHGSASKYADLFDFDTLGLDRYSPQILIDALAAAAAAGYDVAVVDSLSHFWMGTDGMLEQVDKAAKRSGGHGMSGWKEMRPVERQMVEALLAFPGHVICTLRVKTDWVEGENARGKRQMMKVGTKAEQREGLEYEFDLVASMDLSNELTVVKSRCPSLSGEIVTRPGRAFAETFKTWLDDGEQAGPSMRDQLLEQIRAAGDKDQLVAAWTAIGAALKAQQITQTDVDSLIVPAWQARKASVVVEQPAEPKNPGNDPARRKMMALFTEAELGEREQRLAFAAEVADREIESTNDLTDDEVKAVIDRLQRYLEQQNAPVGAGA
ncbi:ATP-binding protein [Actinoplanes sp. Pm04-4]|uniref:ATP-binding protein n=1 Tax=Paractinoplanes pyxinae TaxID=2997416 RepID=A0ABT4B4D6_9ACTN|nr:ATP-binding protein [Actinoplanes pyxinae]MCY1141351.1 ATP-binding protein [Actinoplanes pyxinae]